MERHSVKSVRTAAGAVFLVLGLVLYLILYAPNKFEGNRIITVSKGMTFNDVVDSLEIKGIIRSKTLFELAGHLLGTTREIRIGKYPVHAGISNKGILDILSTGNPAMMIGVTLSEGLRARTFARILQREIGIDSARFVQLVFDPVFTASLGIEATNLEGYLLPETYYFSWQPEEEKVVRTMVEQFLRFYNDSLRIRQQEIGMSMNEVMTLASIVEGETTIDSERPVVAGVYYNRLRKRMRLQADPTIQYIVEDGPRRLRYADLKVESPYNTYLYAGLPPGPINNPGRASILAVLYPAKHRYLYFVADGTGGHVFSQTYSDHQRAVNRYRRFLWMQQRNAATPPAPRTSS